MEKTLLSDVREVVKGYGRMDVGTYPAAHSFRRPNMQSVRLIFSVIAMLIFAVGWGAPTSVFAEQKKPRKQTAEEKKTKACESRNIECVNGCRNGTHLPIGSPSGQIQSCDQNCGVAFNVCMAAMTGGQTGTFQDPSTSGGLMQNPTVNPSPGTGTSKQPAFSGKTPLIMRRGVEGEKQTESAPGTSTPPEQPSGTKGQ